MWNLDRGLGLTPTNSRRASSGYATNLSASDLATAHYPRSALRWALRLTLAITLAIAGVSRGPAALSSNSAILSGTGHAQTCATGACSGGETNGAGLMGQDPGSAACEQFCVRIQQVYHDARTQYLLMLLAQTPTGQDALEYLLAMGAHFGDAFITWRDLRADGNVGETDMGGFIQLDSSRHTERIIIRMYLAGILVHEAVHSSFAVGEGMRDMDSRHADYVSQWFNGKFERELHTLPYYHTLDPFYTPTEGNAYGFTYDAWLNTTNDGQL